tara:strand:+ start:98 stop:1087 length:990 start_codon:yes stop_codon:yes gene_type:complete
MNKKINSMLNFFQTGEQPIEQTKDIEEILGTEKVDLAQLKKAYKDYEIGLIKTHPHQDNLVDDLNEFVERTSTIEQRGKQLRKLNKYVVNGIKYSENPIIAKTPLSKIFLKDIENINPSDLVFTYHKYLNQQSEDFGKLFFGIVEREANLTAYNNHLLKKEEFYTNSIENLSEKLNLREVEQNNLEERMEQHNLSRKIQKIVYERFKLNYRELADISNATKKIIQENSEAQKEVSNLKEWCSGMKIVLAYSKEKMENSAEHLKQTIPTYIQAINLNRSFLESNKVIGELVGIINHAQINADKGLEEVIKFTKSNGVYSLKRKLKLLNPY